MGERKGQHLFNQISKKYQLNSASHTCLDEVHGPQTFDYPYYNLHQILFNLTDLEFDKIMESLKID